MYKKLLCVMILCSVQAFAEETETVEGGTIIVSAEQPTRDLLTTPSAESASLEIATSTVDSEEIRLQDAATWSDAVEFAPGVFTETRGRKNKSFTSFRGQIYPYPDFAMNGIWQREFRDMAYTLPASQIGSVEIVRSSGTLLTGLADIVGVINVLPKKYEKPTTMIEGEYGTFNSWRAGIANGNTTSNGWYTVGASANSTDGPTGRNAAERSESVYGYGGLQATDRLYIEGQFFMMQGARELMTPEPDGPALDSLKNRTEAYDPFTAASFGGKIIFEEAPSATLELSGYYTTRSYDYSQTVINPKKPPKTDQQYTENDHEYGVELIQVLRLSDANTLRVGGVYKHWVCPNGKDFYVGSPQDVESFAAVITDEHQFKKLTLDAGLRVMRDYYNQYSGATFNINGISRDFKTVEDKWGNPLLTATFGGAYHLTEAVSLYGHLAGGQRSKDPGALKQDGTDLKNETRLMGDAGVQLEQNDIGSIKLGGFYVLRRDAVTKTSVSATDVNGDTFYFSDNQDVKQYGVELEARSAPLGGIATLFFNATAMQSKIKPAGAGFQEYREIPKLIFSGGVYAQSGPFDFTLVGKYVSSYENNRFAQDKQYHPLGVFYDINASAGYTFGKKQNTRIYIAAQNLLNDEYSTVVGWKDPGLQFRMGLQHEW